MDDAKVKLFLSNLNEEINHCNKKIEESSRLMDQFNNKKYGLITARDHFIAIQQENK